MKRIIALISILLSFSLLLCGCNKNEETPTDAPTDARTEKPTEPKEPEEIPEGAVILSTEAGLRIIYAEGSFDRSNLVYDELMNTDPKAYNQIGYYTMVKADREYADDGKLDLRLVQHIIISLEKVAVIIPNKRFYYQVMASKTPYAGAFKKPVRTLRAEARLRT